MVFRKKKKNHEDEEEQKDKERKRRKVKKLKPERKRRKEPPKHWGKKERFFVLAILILTIGSSGFLALSSREWKLPGISRIKLPALNFPFSGEETIILEGDQERLRERKRSEEVTKKFNEETKALSGVYGLYVVNLENGFSYGVNETEIFEPASLNKLTVMAAMFIEEEKGNLDLESKYFLKESDKAIGAGSLHTKPEGYEITYRNLIRLMGKQSDNTAFAITRGLLGEEKIQEVTLRIGMKNTLLDENKTTPSDIGIFFEELWFGNIVSEENKNELLDYLTDTVYETLIPEGVPEDVRVAHKYGAETNVLNDAGIIYTPRPIVLVIMGKGVATKEAQTFIPEFTRIVYGD